MTAQAHKPFPVIYAVLSLLVLLCLIGGFRNYNALLNSDQYAYLIYGRSLARGGFAVEYPLLDILRERLPERTQRPLFYGRRFYSGGKVISTLEPGFSLLLAAAIRLGGRPAAFGVNVFLLAVFIASYFLALRREAPESSLAALAAAFVLLGWDDHIVIGYSLKLMRDIPPVAFFWLGIFLARESLRPDGRIFPGFFLGVAALAVSSLVRLTNLAILPPLAVYALISIRRKGWSCGKIILWTAVSAAVFCVIFLPQVLEEAIFLGNPLAFARRALGAFEGFFQRGDAASRHIFSLNNLQSNLPKNLTAIYSLVTPSGLILLAAGIFACRRRLSTWLIMLPTPLIYLLLFSSYGHRARRYRFPLYPFIAYFAVSGALWILNRFRVFREGLSPSTRLVAGLVGVIAAAAVLGWRLIGGAGLDYANIFFLAFILSALLPAAAARGRLWRAAPKTVFVAGTGLILLPYLLGLITQKRSFNWQDAQHLRREIERCAPAGAVILGRRYLIQNVDFYTHAHGISPGNLTAPLGVDLAEAVMIVEESGSPVFALDNRGIRSMEGEMIYLRRYFDLELVCQWTSDELKLNHPYYSNERILSLFRVKRYRREESVLALDTPESLDYLVLFDTGLHPVPEPREGQTLIKINGREYSLELEDGLNYVLIGARDVTMPETSLEVEFNRPVPAVPLRGLFPIGNNFRVDFGVDGDPEDELFVIQGLYLDRGRRRHYRIMGPEAAILLPRLVPPSADGWLELRVRNMLSQPFPLNISIQADEGGVYGRTIPPGGEWQSVKFPLPALSPRGGSFTLTLIAEPSVSTEEEMERLAGSAFLAIDWLEIGWREDGSGSLPDD
ncbi:MAG: hypothetical protein P9M08_08420 [Candidatus Erginobacter occultus]|nr:hypothetical protein [Candidatus Erginobacter occultus]